MGDNRKNVMRVYLDYHSTTPVDKRVVEVMLPYFTEYFGNPSAVHSIGEEAKDAVELSRKSVAEIINAPQNTIHFVSGATEANNIVLKSAKCLPYRIERDSRKPCIITTNSEHSSVRNTVHDLFMNECVDVYYLKIDKIGNIDLQELKSIVSDNERNVVLVSIIAANNEIGTIHDLKKIGQICKDHDVIFHTDATQAVGKTPIDVNEMNIDALSMSAHKIYGPKGIGALYLRDETIFNCLITGGKQEKISSGTINVPGVVGFAKACELMIEEVDEEKRVRSIREKFIMQLLRQTKNTNAKISINGDMVRRLYNNLNISIKNVPAKALVMGMGDVCISTGSACNSGNPQPSHVVTALGLENPECAIRISFGRWTTEDEIIYSANRMAQIINSILEKKNA